MLGMDMDNIRCLRTSLSPITDLLPLQNLLIVSIPFTCFWLIVPPLLPMSSLPTSLPPLHLIPSFSECVWTPQEN